MTSEQIDHMDKIRTEVWERIGEKYRKGQAEHGGNLWDKKNLIDMAIEEAIDQATYLITLREQIEAAGVELGTVQD